MMPINKKLLEIVLCAGLLLLTGHLTAAQQTTADAKAPTMTGPANLSQAQIDDIIRRFTAKETQFRQALNTYAFKRDALIQQLGMGGQVVGEYHRVSDFTFDDQGNRFEKINFFPMPTFASMTQEDLEDLGGVNPFALEAGKLGQYNFKFVGKERIDELDLYVFDVAPKVMPKKSTERMFDGSIWVDDKELQINKSKGKGVPETKNNKFPVVETYRQQIDGKYWFPVYAYADDDIIFDNGSDLRIRMRVKYTDYVVGHGKVRITEVGQAPEDTKPQPQPTSAPQSDTQQKSAPPTQRKSNVDTSADERAPSDKGILNSQAIDLPRPAY